MTKKPVRRYTVDGKRMTEMETIAIIFRRNACRGRERMARTGPQAAPEMTIPRGT